MPAITYDLRRFIPASPAAAWGVLADYSRDAEWREDVAMRCEPAGLVREGTRTFETLRLLGKTHENTARIDRVEPGVFFRFRGETGNFEGTRALRAKDGGCEVHVTLRVELPARMALGAIILGFLFRRRVKRDLARLAALVLSSRPATALSWAAE